MNPSRADDLTRALLDFTGKSTDALERFATAHALDASLIAELCDFAAERRPAMRKRPRPGCSSASA